MAHSMPSTTIAMGLLPVSQSQMHPTVHDYPSNGHQVTISTSSPLLGKGGPPHELKGSRHHLDDVLTYKHSTQDVSNMMMQTTSSIFPEDKDIREVQTVHQALSPIIQVMDLPVH